MPSSSKVSRRADCERRLARIHLAARPVDFARAETAFLADEENLLLSHDEEEIGADAAVARLPSRSCRSITLSRSVCVEDTA